jgi:RHS repeat-associated protein
MHETPETTHRSVHRCNASWRRPAALLFLLSIGIGFVLFTGESRAQMSQHEQMQTDEMQRVVRLYEYRQAQTLEDLREGLTRLSTNGQGNFDANFYRKYAYLFHNNIGRRKFESRGNPYGASYVVPVGAFRGDNLVGYRERFYIYEGGYYPEGTAITSGAVGYRSHSGGWNFEPPQAGVLVRSWDMDNYSAPFTDATATSPGYFTESCEVRVRYRFIGRDGTIAFGQRGLTQGRHGNDLYYRFFHYTYTNFPDDSALSPQECRRRAILQYEAEAPSMMPTEFWSDDGQIALSVANPEAPVITYPDGSRQVFQKGGNYAPFNKGLMDVPGEDLDVAPDRLYDVARSIDANGNVTSLTYASGGVATVTTPSGNIIRYDRQDGRITAIRTKGVGGKEHAWKMTWTTFTWDLKTVFPRLACDNPLFEGFDGEMTHFSDGRKAGGGCGQGSYTTLTRLEGPDGLAYNFGYDLDPYEHERNPNARVGFGNLTYVRTPTGAVTIFKYGKAGDGQSFTPLRWEPDQPSNGDPLDLLEYRVVERLDYPNGLGGESYRTFIEHELDTVAELPGGVAIRWVRTTRPDGSFTRIGSAFLGKFAGAGGQFDASFEGRTLATETYDRDGVLREAQYFAQLGHIPDARPETPFFTTDRPSDFGGPPRSVDIRSNKSIRFLDGVYHTEIAEYAGTVPVTTFRFQGSNSLVVIARTSGNITKRQVIGADGRLLAETQTDYVDDAPYLARNLIRLPRETRVHGPAGIESRTAHRYDEWPLSPSGAQNLDPQVGEFRGNLTTIIGFAAAESAGGEVLSRMRYYDTGNVFQVTDPRGNTTSSQYDFGTCSASNLSLETVVTSPAPDPSSNPQPHVTKTATDCYTGKILEKTDANNLTTRFVYDEADRLRQVYLPQDPDGQPSEWYEHHTLANGATVRTQRVVKHVKDGSPDGMVTVSFNDGLGRSWRVGHRVGAGTWSVTDTAYDSMGRAAGVSNPYHAQDLFGELNPSGQWTTTEHDALGRALSVTTPDGARRTTVYRNGSAVVTDAAGQQREFVYDELRRLVRVIEDPAGLAYVTEYHYDAIGNLRQVRQGEQQRFFLYDSLSRLIRAKNPEQEDNPALALFDPLRVKGGWSAGYTYDANGNLKTRVDARGIETTYGYDHLNRVTSVTYNDGATRGVSLSYDGAVNGKGRPWVAMTFDPKNRGMMVAGTRIDSYDAMGRVLVQSQEFPSTRSRGAAYRVQQRYNPAGQVEETVYPSGRKVQSRYGQGGRLAGLEGSLGDGLTRVYADQIQYNAAGQKTRERWGTLTPLYHNRHYNNRLQPYDIRLGTEAADLWTWNRGALRLFYDANYAYGDGDFANNGNLYRIDHFMPLEESARNWVMSTAWYGYDRLNRILGIWETKTSSADPAACPLVFSQVYKYDRYGNRTIDGQETSRGSTINRIVFTADARTNRFQELAYDPAGNVTYDRITGTGQREYDAENRIVAAEGTGGLSFYGYDAQGRRISRTENGQTWWTIYGIGGELLAEYRAGSAPSSPEKEYGYQDKELLVVSGKEGFKWLLKDHLGTPRMVVDYSGSLGGITRHDYLPFGEEIEAGIGARETATGYRRDGLRQKFTGKERDAETGLDYFMARYFASAQGRFTSTDPLNIPGLQRLDAKKFQQVIRDPHNWNGYAYAHNNPLSKLDPDGFLTIIIPGTWNDFNAWNKSDFRKWVKKTFGEDAVVVLWSGGDNNGARTEAATKLADFINHHMKHHPGEKLNIVAHSHGGNVAFEASHKLKHKIDTLVTLGTPIRGDYKPNRGNISQHLNVYSSFDPVQINGGRLPFIPQMGGLGSIYGQIGPAGRRMSGPGVTNLNAWLYAPAMGEAHSALWQNPDVWHKVVEPALKK